MGIVSWVLVGLIAGWLAGLVMNIHGTGLVGDLILGVIGAVVGGFLASALFSIPDALVQFDLSTLIVAFLGAVVVVAIVRGIPGRTAV